jgi:periplasmic protein TonB
METKALVARNWDDLVFTGRNREYGAYPIRQSYSKRLMIGFGVTNAALIILFLMLDFGHGAPIKKLVDPIIEKGEHFFDPPPVFPEKLPTQKMQRQEKVVNRTNTAIQVVQDPVVDVPVDAPPADVAPLDEGSDSGTGTPDGLVTGASDLPIVEVPSDKIFITAEIMPKYEGGIKEMMKFIKKKIRFPRSAERIGVEGTVFVSFVVNGDGTIRDVSVLRGISRECDEEAMRVISLLPGWIGGKQNGNPVAVRMVLPITFNINH